MKRFYKFLMPLVLIVAMALPWKASAQTLTVADGTTTNGYIPFYGTWMDASQHNQVLYPASLLTSMENNYIVQMAFYMSTPNTTMWNAPVTIKMATVTDTAIGTSPITLSGTDTLVTVWTGTVNGGVALLNFILENPFMYEGGNLLVDITTTAATYNAGYFAGVTATGASYYSYNTSSAGQDFLPKTTFGYNTTGQVCYPPTNFAVAASGDTATFTWTDTHGSAWELVYAAPGFDPDDEDLTPIDVTNTTYMATDIPAGFYDAYVRANCGTDDKSLWVGPVTFGSGISIMNMAVSGTDTLHTCNAVIYDDGGPSGTYSPSCQSTLIVMPNAENNALLISGNSYTESTYDYLRIYDGIGTTGDVLFDDYGVSANQTFGPFYAGGPVTIVFHSDPSVNYSGFEIHVSCAPMPDCARPETFNLLTLLADSAEFSWTDNQGTQWGIEYGPAGFTRGNENDTSIHWAYFTDTTGWIENLIPGTNYDFYLVSICSENSWARMITAQTPCLAIPTDSLPYHYGFEDATTGASGSINPCWRKFVGGNTTNYPYASTSYAAEGTKSLYFYGYSNTYYCYAVMPLFEAPLNTLNLDFKLYKTSSSYGSLEVGVMTNPSDLSTFQSLGFYQPTALNTWESFRVNLGAYTGSGTFIAFVQRTSYYTYLDDITVSLRPECPNPVNVAIQATSASSAYATWNYASGYEVEPDSYTLTVLDTAGVVNTINGVSSTEYMISGLTPNTEYTLRVESSCGGDLSEADSVTFSTRALGCLAFDTTQTGTPLQIGDGTGTSYYLPINNFYNYSYTQQLYDAEELGGAMPITGIDFEYAASSSNSAKDSVVIYLANVTASSLASGFVPYNASTFVPVYAGPMVCTNGWNHFDFTQTFQYDGTGNLLVAINDLSGDYDGTAYTFRTHPATGKGRYVQNDANPYTISAVTGGTSAAYRVNTKFSTYACAQMATCAAPLATVNNITATSANLLWAAGNGETSWTVEHKAANAPAWTVDLATTTTTTLNVTGLQPNTEYLFRVSHVCGADTFATVTSATTLCLPAAVPFSEDFNNWASGSAGATASCWYRANNYSESAYYPYISSSYALNGSQSMYMYSTNSSYSYLVLPQLDAPMDTLTISFYLMKTNTSYTHALNVGVMTDPTDISTFYQVGTATPTAPTYEWQGFEFNMAGAPEGNIVIMSPMGAYCYPYLDNLEVTYYNPCERPTAVNDSANTVNSAVIYWTDAAATDFTVEYGPSGFALGTGTQVTVNGSHTVTLTGLNHSSRYDVYVRGLCSTGSSQWSFVHSFLTECAPIDVLPFTENFDNWGANADAPYCWTYGSDYNSSYPYINNVTEHGGTMYMYVYDYNHVGNKTWFALPELTSTIPVNQTQVVFSTYTSTSSYVHPVMVGVGNNSTLDTTVVWIDTVMANYNEWNEYEVPFDSYTGTGRYIFFATAVDSAYSYSYPYIDDLTLEMIPSCRRPDSLYATGATTTTVQLGWHERSGATSWVIEYGPMGFELGTGTVVVANSNPFTLTGLPAAYLGEFYVRSVCSSTDTGDYSRRPFAFGTTQIPATIPYNYDFENVAEWNNWQTSTNHAVNNWYRGTAVADSGSYAMYISADSGATYKPYLHNAVVNAAAYRDIDFGTIDSSFTISFRARVGGTLEHNYDGLMVFLVDPSIATVPSNSNITSPWGNVNDLYRIASVRRDTNWSTYTASFDTIHGIHRVAFFWFNQSTTSYANLGEPAAVDNIHIDYSACPRPVLLDTVHIGGNNATLAWQGPANANYQVAYRMPGDTVYQYATTNTNSITLTGLNSAATYYAWVRKLCGADTSLYSDGISFATSLCDAPEMFANYDTASAAGTSSYSPIGYSYYNYSYVQTIIDSAVMAQFSGDITAFGFLPANTTASDEFDGMTVYMANVPESNLSSGFIHPDSNHVFVQVISGGNFNYTEADWQYKGFENPFTWDGHSNVLFAVKRDNGSYTSGASFSAHTATASKMRYANNDNNPYDINSVTGGTASSTVGDIRLISCGAGCPMPIASTPTVTYNSATINWTGSDVTEVKIQQGLWDASVGTAQVVTTGTITFSDLLPTTAYTIGMRNICEDGTYSDWLLVPITTADLPCFAPTGVAVTNVTSNGGTITWTEINNATEWEVRVTGTNYDSTYTVSTTPSLTVTGLYQGVTYSVIVRAFCAATVQSEWTEPVTLTPTSCERPTDVAVSVNGTSATVTWNGTADRYEVAYNYQGDGLTGATTQMVTGTSVTLTGLDPETAYEVVVRAYCGEVISLWSDAKTFTTGTSGIDGVEGSQVNLYPNPASTMVTLDGIEGEAQVTLVDMNGRVVYTQSLSHSATQSLKIDLTGMAKGAYFVRITGERTNAIRKLIVK